MNWWSGDWLFNNQTGSGFKGINKYHGYGSVGSIKDGGRWRRATAKRRTKRRKKSK